MKIETLEKDCYYHVYNRGINSCAIFNNEENMDYFLKLASKHLYQKATILAYCLMNNHFHFAIQITEHSKVVSQAFSNLFNAYSKAFNKQNNRTGTLFERPYKRIKIKDENYLKKLVLYIHKNPQNHKIINNFKKYKFTSYQHFLSSKNSIITTGKGYVINLFNDLKNFKDAHQTDLSGFQNLTGLTEKKQNSKEPIFTFNNKTIVIYEIAEKDAWSICDFIIANEERLTPFFPKTKAQNLTPTLSKRFTKLKKEAFEAKKEFLFTVKTFEEKKIIGLVYIKELDWNIKQGEFAYCIDYKFEGKGITSKIVEELSRYAFHDLGLERLQIIVHKTNLPSIGVAKKCGFSWVKTLEQKYTPENGIPLDMELYELYKETSNLF